MIKRKKKMVKQAAKKLVFEKEFFNEMDRCIQPYGQMFDIKGISIDRDMLILNEIIRRVLGSSGILEGEPVDIVISDEKIKKMFTEWVNGAY